MMKYGIKITKPWSKEMYAHNEEVKETVINEVRDRWEIAYQEAEQHFLDDLEEDQQGMLFEDSDWLNANQTMQEIQEAVTIVNFASGFEIKDVTEEVENELDNAPFYRLKEIAEELELELEEEFIGL
mgnify:FL=1|tara:strand:+ start:44 stop:424 length:381 start_codon:yes stop_codon:yes gene_type:complete